MPDIEQIKELKAKIEYLENYCPRVESMTSSTGNYIPHQYIIKAYGKTIFQSYGSVVAVKYSDGSIVLGEDWDYSRTTGRYRNEFLGEGIAETRKKLEDGTYTIDGSL